MSVVIWCFCLRQKVERAFVNELLLDSFVIWLIRNDVVPCQDYGIETSKYVFKFVKNVLKKSRQMMKVIRFLWGNYATFWFFFLSFSLMHFDKVLKHFSNFLQHESLILFNQNIQFTFFLLYPVWLIDEGNPILICFILFPLMEEKPFAFFDKIVKVIPNEKKIPEILNNIFSIFCFLSLTNANLCKFESFFSLETWMIL